MIWEGDRERPLGMLAEARRECRFDAAGAGAAAAAGADLAAGMSRVLSLRPVVGSVTESRAGSCETW